MQTKEAEIKDSEKAHPKKAEITIIPGSIDPHIANAKEINDSHQYPYDSKTYIKKRLEDLIPQSKCFFQTGNERKHMKNFYLDSKSNLTINESSATILPSIMKETYSDFSGLNTSIKFKDALHSNKEAESLINSYENESGEKYVIKRCWHHFKVDKSTNNSLEELEDFIRDKFNEYTILKIINSTSQSVLPMEFQIIHLPNIKYIVTELLVPFGGTPLTECIQILSSEDIYEIVRQFSNMLENLDSFNIELNYIKADSILVASTLGKISIRFYEFEIGKNILVFNKSAQGSGVSEFASIYCSPEMYQMATDISEKSRNFNWRKGQMYSLGVLILFMYGFFPNEIKCDQFNKNKQTELIYERFMANLLDTAQSIVENLKKKLMKITEMCLLFKPENRLSLQELKEILISLDSTILETISNQYSIIIHSKKSILSSNQILLNENENFITKIQDECHLILQEEDIITTRLSKENVNLVNKKRLKKEEIANNKFSANSLKNLLGKSNLEVEKFQKLLKEKSKNFKATIVSDKFEDENALANAKPELEGLFEKVNIIKKENENFNLKKTEFEEKIKITVKKLSSLEEYGKRYQENTLKLDTIIKKLENNKKIGFLNSKSYTELARNLHETILNCNKNNKIPKKKFVENLKISDNSIYSGQVNQKNQPQGVGTLMLLNTYSKTIGEFQNGKCKNNIGFMKIKNDETYTFGKIQTESFKNMCLFMYEFPSILGKNYYCGEAVNNLQNGIGKKVYSDGEYYVGEWTNDIREGNGKHVYSDSAYYDGEWKNNNREGKGKYISPNGVYYEGEWINNKKEGKGKHVYSDSAYYEGEWKNNTIEGKGKYTYLNGEYYEGEWINNKKEGKGKHVYSDGAYYEGAWKNNSKEGSGKYADPSGSYYKGEWKNNIKEGKGLYVNQSGSYYDGSWKNNKAEGKGKSVFPNGEYYEGEWIKNKKEGKGKHIYPSGASYEGEWKNDKAEGIGKYVYSNGEYYEGGWKNGKKEGNGRHIYPSGTYYEGEWKNNKAEGKIKAVYSDGERYEGESENENKEGKGKSVFPNGECYDGEWKNNKKEGKGKYVYPNGAYFEGEWKNDTLKGKIKTVYSDGGYYEGEWKNDKKEGKGKYVYSTSGVYYEGEWKNDNKEGKGKYVYSTSGEYYEGEWKNDYREGKGKEVYGRSGYYDGEFINDNREGKGIYVAQGGQCYQGRFKDGKLVGKAKTVKTNGSYFFGELINFESNGRRIYYDSKEGRQFEIHEGKWNRCRNKFTISNLCTNQIFSIFKCSEPI